VRKLTARPKDGAIEAITARGVVLRSCLLCSAVKGERRSRVPDQAPVHGTARRILVDEFACNPETANSITRIYSMDRDIIMLLAVLVLTIALTWTGTDYIVDHIVQPLMDEEASPVPGYPTR
jgi:hypothetical protein